MVPKLKDDMGRKAEMAKAPEGRGIGTGNADGVRGGGGREMLRWLALGLAALAALGVLAGCAGAALARTVDEGARPVHVYAREDGSGTRSAFVERLGIRQQAPDGQQVDRTAADAAVTNSTFVMLSSVAGDPGAIGYVSLGSLGPDAAVAVVPVDGVTPTAATVRDGSYPVARSFCLVTAGGLDPAAADFAAFALSAEGQAVVGEAGYVAVADDPAPYRPSGVEGKVVVAGSSSVCPVAERLAEAYEALNPAVAVEVQQSDSTTGVAMALAGTCDIGLASRDLTASEQAGGATSQPLARDGIAVIASPENPAAAAGLSAAQVRAVYTGAVTDWADV